MDYESHWSKDQLQTNLEYWTKIKNKGNINSLSPYALKTWIEYGLYVDEQSIVTDILDCCNVPVNLSYKERIAYYQLFRDNYDK